MNLKLTLLAVNEIQLIPKRADAPIEDALKEMASFAQAVADETDSTGYDVMITMQHEGVEYSVAASHIAQAIRSCITRSDT